VSFSNTNNPCPCESGLDYSHCCASSGQAANEHELDLVQDPKLLTQLPSGVQAAINDVISSPDFFPVKIVSARNEVQWVKMSPFWYEGSDFLDANRILGRYFVKTDINWMLDKASGIEWQFAPCIFHTAFCGSTLMSKALASLYDCLPLREPDVMGNLAAAIKQGLAVDTRMAHTAMALLSRRYNPYQIAVLKANDHSNALMSPLQQWKPVPILFMFVPLAEFVVACLRAENRKAWIRDRYRYINKTGHLNDDEYASMAAHYWCYNVNLYEQACREHPEQMRSLNFNVMLDNPLETIQSCADWFQLKPKPGIDIRSELSSVMNVYSKGAQAYSPEQRRQDIQKWQTQYKTEISQAEQYAKEMMGEAYPGDSLSQPLSIEATVPPVGEPNKSGFLSRLSSVFRK